MNSQNGDLRGYGVTEGEHDQALTEAINRRYQSGS